jgi:hypothetical protein
MGAVAHYKFVSVFYSTAGPKCNKKTPKRADRSFRLAQDDSSGICTRRLDPETAQSFSSLSFGSFNRQDSPELLKTAEEGSSRDLKPIAWQP